MDYACKISVIIPVYNMAQYLDQTIASWTAQTLKDIEIIYIDDGSSDDSLRILKEKAKADNRLHVCAFTANKGTWAARNYGIEKATGQYILFADADDTVLPETCEELALAMDESQTNILQYPIEVLNPNGLPEHDIAGCERWLTPYDGVQHGKDVFTICFRKRKHCWNLSGKVFKTEICKEVLSDIAAAGFQDEHIIIAEDALLYFMLSYTAKSYMGIHGKKYYQYYFGNGGFGRKVFSLAYFEDLCRQSQVSELMKAFLERHDILDTYEDIIRAIRVGFLNITVWSWINNLAHIDKAHGFDLMLRYWNSAEVIGKLAEFCFKNSQNIAKYVQNATMLKYDGHKVKTIATYYQRLAYGGTERVLCQLCYLWTAMGYKVIVLTDEEPSEDDFKLPVGTERITIPSFKSIITPHKYINRGIAIQRIIQDYKIDAVVYHDWLQTNLLWDELAIKSSGAAFIIHCHNIFPIGMLWMDRYNLFIEQFILADAIITITKTDYAFWRYYNSNVYFTINPLSEEITDWNPTRYQNNHHILWLARLSGEKNPSDIIPIMQDVVRAVPDAFLSIVGRSENGMIEKQLQKEITKLHLEDHIKLEGFHKNVRSWYLTSQIFLMTSTYEGDPMTLRESKMAGIPCVMYELPHLTLCEGNRGIIAVPQRDTAAAAQAIIKLLQDDILCAQYGHEARAHIEELAHFDFPKKWQQIFESLEHTHAPIVSKTEKQIIDMLIAFHEQNLQDAKIVRDREIKKLKKEIQQLRHGSYIKRVTRAVVPNRVKPFIKVILHRIPQGLKNPVKRLLRW